MVVWDGIDPSTRRFSVRHHRRHFNFNFGTRLHQPGLMEARAKVEIEVTAVMPN
jgi:hypothetical protein